MRIFLYTTTERISYAGAWLVQGLVQSGHTVLTNSQTLQCDGRLSVANLRRLPNVITAAHDGTEDVVLVDETRSLASIAFAQIEEFYKPLQDIATQRPVGLLYMQDDANFVTFPEGIRIFCAHKNRLMEKQADTLALPFGFPQELLDLAYAAGSQKKERSPVILSNFNPTFDQSVRESLYFTFEQAINPTISISQDHSHGQDYVNALMTHSAILAYGGKYYQPLTDHDYLRDKMSPDDLRRHSFSIRHERVAIFRWDSYRLWEAWLFGCIPITLDFERYGFVLPEPPVPYRHYLPLQLDKISIGTKSIVETFLKGASSHGAQYETFEWVAEFYAPRVSSERLLRQLV